MKAIYLYDVTWLTTDVHRLMSCLSITYLDHLVLRKTCQLRCSLSSDSPSSPVKVNILQIGTSLTITTLESILSQIDVNRLTFHAGCQVLDMDMNTTPTPQVSQGHLYEIYNMFNSRHKSIRTNNVFLGFQNMM